MTKERRTWNRYGITLEDYKQAEENGIKKSIVYDRVARYGWTVENAITTLPMDIGKRRKTNNKR